MWIIILLSCLILLGVALLVLTIRKIEWGRPLRMVVAILLILCGSVPLVVGIVNHQIVLEIRAPRLEVTDILLHRHPDENVVDLVARIENRGADIVEECTAEAKMVGTADKYHLSVSDTINSGDWGEVWVARAVKEEGVWKTWLVTPQLAESLKEGYFVERISWAKPIPWGSYQVGLTIFAQTQSPLHLLELTVLRESAPTLRLVE